MTGDLIGWIVGAILAFLGVAGIYAKGRQTGKDKERERQATVNQQAEQKRHETVTKAKDVAVDVSNLPDSDAEQRLRDKYTRD